MNAVIAGELSVGSKGVPVVIDAGGFYMQGSTATLIAAPDHQEGPALTLKPLSISADGLYATYITTGNDFTVGGPWRMQLEVVTADGEVIPSKPGKVYIYPRLRNGSP